VFSYVLIQNLTLSFYVENVQRCCTIWFIYLKTFAVMSGIVFRGNGIAFLQSVAWTLSINDPSMTFLIHWRTISLEFRIFSRFWHQGVRCWHRSSWYKNDVMARRSWLCFGISVEAGTKPTIKLLLDNARTRRATTTNITVCINRLFRCRMNVLSFLRTKNRVKVGMWVGHQWVAHPHTNFDYVFNV
jgi:hypothetical protein